MKRIILTSLAVIAFTAGAVADDNETQYQLKSGNLTMMVDAGKGGKILSLKHGDAELISQSRWPESFGSTFWTSPQKEWNWPPVFEFDKNPYTVEQHSDSTLVIRSQVSEKLKYSIGKSIRACRADGSFVITYSIYNESGETRQVAPWEITRVPNADGLIFFDAPLDGITPAGLLEFTAAERAVWYHTDQAPDNRKINADGKGWLAYYNNGLLLVKAFQDLKPEEPAPGEAEIQVYMNRGKSFIELESQGAYTTLAPGSKLDWTVKWYLLPVDAQQDVKKACRDAVARLLGK